MTRFNLQTRAGCSRGYEEIANRAGEVKDQIGLSKLLLAKKCIDGSVYLNGTLPAKVAQLVHEFKGTPYVDIPLTEAEGRKMIRGARNEEKK